MIISPTFFVITGAILLLSGLLQILVRPRDVREVGLQRFVNRATVRATLFVLVGLGAVLLGLGVIPMARLGL